MNRYLLDTHTLIWWLKDDERLSKTAKSLVANIDNTIYVSSASFWEISTKNRIGKLPDLNGVIDHLVPLVRKEGFQDLRISSEHAFEAGRFDNPHRDPFDRMLAAQAMQEGLSLITKDPAFESFDVLVEW